jgi:hypothetical protein
MYLQVSAKRVVSLKLMAKRYLFVSIENVIPFQVLRGAGASLFWA